MIACTWCADPNADEIDNTLCRTHEAEAGGYSVADIDRRDATHYAEWLDTVR